MWPLRICSPHHLVLCDFLYVVEDGISQCPILATCCDGSFTIMESPSGTLNSNR